MFKVLREVIRALMGISRETRKRMTMATRGSILWIILLQSHQFELGEVNILCEFTTMHGGLQAKRATIRHIEMPLELLTNSTDTPPLPTTRTPEIQVLDVDNTHKKPRVANTNNWHPNLKVDLEGPLREAGNPTFKKIMNYWKKDACLVVPKGSPICAPNYLFRSYFSKEKCTKKHVIANDSQVQTVLVLVESFLKDPRKINAGQSIVK